LNGISVLPSEADVLHSLRQWAEISIHYRHRKDRGVRSVEKRRLPVHEWAYARFLGRAGGFQAVTTSALRLNSRGSAGTCVERRHLYHLNNFEVVGARVDEMIEQQPPFWLLNKRTSRDVRFEFGIRTSGCPPTTLTLWAHALT
jgi:hypothetical protein